jgi:DNA-directed RNA polymerase specialized sigma24 family protein
VDLARPGREAFEELFRLTQEPLYRYIFSLVGARALAEDIHR